MNLTIDIGNTLCKLAVFNIRQIVLQSKCTLNQLKVELLSMHQSFNIERCIVSSVIEIDKEILANISGEPPLFFNSQTPIPLKNLYHTPETLGIDRLAAAVGAEALYPCCHKLVIDCGTAITLDYVTANSEYMGGNISPGLQLRFRALHEFTGRLPMLAPDDQFSLIGRSTKEALVNGVQNGIIFELDAYINKFTEMYPGLQVVLTGGDAIFLLTS
ncbi:MAG: type III pantothenate kinase [Bacteroidales bacterium]|nr:type III pantothenate kinase [Bacteroidales bacterium]